MIGRALISANMNGEIGYQDKQTIILYSPKESAKRMNEYRQEKVEAVEASNSGALLPEETNVVEEGEIETETVEDADKETATEEKVEEEKIEKVAKKKKTKQLKFDDIKTEE